VSAAGGETCDQARASARGWVPAMAGCVCTCPFAHKVARYAVQWRRFYCVSQP
jgi:hypothetical protein